MHGLWVWQKAVWIEQESLVLANYLEGIFPGLLEIDPISKPLQRFAFESFFGREQNSSAKPYLHEELFKV